MSERYFIDSDDDGHWFVIPVARQQEWNEWRDLPSDDERAWDYPYFARAVGGVPSLITFEVAYHE